MPSLTEAYLARLTKRIGRKIPVDEAQDHIREIRQHIEESCAERTRHGFGPREAEIEALMQVGSERLIAESLVREHRGVGVRSAWRIALVPSAVLLVAFLLPEAFMVWPITMEAMDIMIWLPAIGTALFVIACLRSRRILILPAAAVFLLSYTGSLVFFANGPSGVTARAEVERQKNIVGFDREIARLRSDYATAKAVTASSSLPPTLRTGTKYLAPRVEESPSYARSVYNPIGRETPSRHRVVLEPAATEAEAKVLWQQSGSAYAHQLATDISEQQSERSYWVQTKGGWKALGQAAAIGIVFTLQAIALFSCINLAAFGGLILRDRIIRSRWRPERANRT